MAKETTLNELGQMLSHVVEHMASKDDISALRQELKGDIAAVQVQVNSIEQQFRKTKIDRRLGDLEEEVFGKARP